LPTLARYIVMFTVLAVWVVVVGFRLKRGESVDVTLLGIPGLTVAALWPPLSVRRREDTSESEPTEEQ
jgi:hypothetical protein